MIRFLPRTYGRSEWDSVLAELGEMTLPQIWAWGTAKTETGSWRVERGILSVSAKTVGAAQVIVRTLPVIGGGLAWVARGPLCARGEMSRYPALLAALRCYYVKERGLHLRVAPAVPVTSAPKDAFSEAGFRQAGAPGWTSAVLDLSMSEEALRLRLAQKWRNGLNKAERLEVSVDTARNDAEFGEVIAHYRNFLRERGFSSSVTPELLARLQQHLPDDRKMTAWRCMHAGELLGTAVIITYGNRCEYLAGTLTETGRRYNAGQILLWRAILAERRAGTLCFDLGGTDPLLTPKGILDFKSGLGGTTYCWADEIEADDAGLRARVVRWRIARSRGKVGAGA